MKGNNKKKHNYFSDNAQKYGDAFLQQFDAKRLRSDARRVFSDIAFGNIDFDKYWQYFTEPMFVNALIDAANTKITIHGISYAALVEQQKSATNSEIVMVTKYHERQLAAYQLFYDCFMRIKSNGFSISSTSELKSLGNLVSQYKNDLVEPMFANVNSGFVYGHQSQLISYSIPNQDTFDHSSIGKDVDESEPEYLTPHFIIKDQ